MSSNRIRPELVLLLLLAATLIPLLQAGIVGDLGERDPDSTTLDPSPYAEQQQLESQMEMEMEPSVQVDGRRIDCKLTFDAATMDSLGCHNQGALPEGRAWPGSGSGNKPELEKPVENPDWQRHLKSPDSQPIYELQLVVWPSDIEDGDDFSPPLATTTARTTTTTRTTRRSTTTRTPSTTPRTTPRSSTTTQKPTQIGTPIEQIWPLYEDQLVVFPQMDFEEENLDYFFDDSNIH